MPRRKFSIASREFGRTPAKLVRFSTLAAAAKYIQDRWQGCDYCDREDCFHTDYCTYELRGFTLHEVGRFWLDPDSGCREFTFAADEQGPPIALHDDGPADAGRYSL